MPLLRWDSDSSSLLVEWDKAQYAYKDTLTDYITAQNQTPASDKFKLNEKDLEFLLREIGELKTRVRLLESITKCN